MRRIALLAAGLALLVSACVPAGPPHRHDPLRYSAQEDWRFYPDSRRSHDGRWHDDRRGRDGPSWGHRGRGDGRGDGPRHGHGHGHGPRHGHHAGPPVFCPPGFCR